MMPVVLAQLWGWTGKLEIDRDSKSSWITGLGCCMCNMLHCDIVQSMQLPYIQVCSTAIWLRSSSAQRPWTWMPTPFARSMEGKLPASPNSCYWSDGNCREERREQWSDTTGSMSKCTYLGYSWTLLWNILESCLVPNTFFAILECHKPSELKIV